MRTFLATRSWGGLCPAELSGELSRKFSYEQFPSLPNFEHFPIICVLHSSRFPFYLYFLLLCTILKTIYTCVIKKQGTWYFVAPVVCFLPSPSMTPDSGHLDDFSSLQPSIWMDRDTPYSACLPSVSRAVMNSRTKSCLDWRWYSIRTLKHGESRLNERVLPPSFFSSVVSNINQQPSPNPLCQELQHRTTPIDCQAHQLAFLRWSI